ncbi:SMI1/KNR4 family protein [Streptomyces gibsoniae]|uniref:SMI1/KNR4 family protein n=1 Tax=Streptomyces gibsoniae TaxID=3075529 RepID=A0ABU2TKD8_9ACTN|nr:SMI1/KNR4 family protein [Streptomyces sp. DSM 41699]MDT0461405.1 SMI1/KNR4 family protein [Streptomyces sp. DSM 41699]
MPSIDDFATWAPVLRLLRAAHADSLAVPGGHVTGQIGIHSWSLHLPRRMPPPGQAAQLADMQDEYDAVQLVQAALTEAGIEGMSFVAEISPSGHTALDLFGPSPAVEQSFGVHPGALVLVEDSVPEPWRRLPEPVPGAAPAPSVDLALLERTLRERIPDAVAATEEEIAAAETRLGVTLPNELKVLYGVTRAKWEDFRDDDGWERVVDAVGFEPFSPDELSVADASSRPSRWQFGAMEAVVTPPDAAIQGLVGSPGWIVLGDTGGGDRVAVDLTPGPRGHTGQIIVFSHEDRIGADLLARSLTDLVVNGPEDGRRHRGAEPGAVAWVNRGSLSSVQAAAHPGLEALSIGVWEEEPVSLAPVIGLPRLRTLRAYPGTLADPLEIAGLTGLEFLELAPEEWRVLLDAGAVPRSLSAASVDVHGDRHPLPIVNLANELLALWNRPPIPRTTLVGDLGPLA